MPEVLICSSCNCTVAYPHGPYAYELCFSNDEKDLQDQLGVVTQVLVVSVSLCGMIAFGMKLDTSQITLANVSGPVAVAFFGQVVCNPLVMVLLLKCFDLEPKVRLCALMVSVSPGGVGSNFLTWIANGSLTISVMCTALSTIAALGTFPAYVYAGTRILDLEEISPSLSAIVAAIGLVTIPVGIGATINYYLGGPRVPGEDHTRTIDKVSSGMLFVAVVIVVVLVPTYLISPLDRAYLDHATLHMWGCCLVQNIAGLLLGYAVSFAAGLPPVFHRSIAFEVGAQNTLIALTTATLAFEATQRGILLSYIIAYLMIATVVNYGTAFGFRYLTPVPEQFQDLADRTAAEQAQSNDATDGLNGDTELPMGEMKVVLGAAEEKAKPDQCEKSDKTEAPVVDEMSLVQRDCC